MRSITRTQAVLATIGAALLVATLVNGCDLARAVPITAAAVPQREVELCKQLSPRLAKQYGGKFECEARLWDDSRVDLLSDEYAVEVDYAHKWAECVGQALYYGHLTDRQPVCLLLAAGVTESHFVYRCQTVCEAHGIRLWVVQIDANGDLKK